MANLFSQRFAKRRRFEKRGHPKNFYCLRESRLSHPQGRLSGHPFHSMLLHGDPVAPPPAGAGP
ncbi:hypothetical protein F1542_07285 [Komagataeibacter sp. FXV3]|nr:hypothetical protein [Komagataeibacter sp. FXV3]